MKLADSDFFSVSIHAPRVGCDWRWASSSPLPPPFQFTHPVWGATGRYAYRWFAESSFNSRTPCGVRRLIPCTWRKISRFQFTHPVWGATLSILSSSITALAFQFTHPVWGATQPHAGQVATRMVSIHAPRVGCDSPMATARGDQDVSIHAPRVGCDADGLSFSVLVFGVSIHAPRVGCDAAGDTCRKP